MNETVATISAVTGTAITGFKITQLSGLSKAVILGAILLVSTGIVHFIFIKFREITHI